MGNFFGISVSGFFNTSDQADQGCEHISKEYLDADSVSHFFFLKTNLVGVFNIVFINGLPIFSVYFYNNGICKCTEKNIIS